MTKTILITETQYNKLIKENLEDEFRDFEVNAELDFDLIVNTVDGRYVYDINGGKTIRIMFDLDVYIRKWGIDSIGITNVRGPKTMDINLTLEAIGENDGDELVEHTINLNWSDVEINYEYSDNRQPRSIERILIVLDDILSVEKIIVEPAF
jgi:hypothetical protein